jgi:diguanylate cyclase (GGDEF)-like protein/PAS domain S-box-containing protein
MSPESPNTIVLLAQAFIAVTVAAGLWLRAAALERRSHRSLRSSEKQLQCTVEAQLHAFMTNSPSGMFIKDMNGKYLCVNEQFLRPFDLTRERVLGSSDIELFTPEIAAPMSANDDQLLCGKNVIEFEHESHREDGRHTNLVCKFPLHDAAGKIFAYGGIVTDITGRLNAEESARRQAVQQRLIAGFGQFALENPEIDELILEATQVIKDGLQPEYCRYLELAQNESNLLFKAGFGWHEDAAGRMTYDTVTETEDRFSIGARDAVLVRDFAADMRHKPSPVLAAHGVRSGVEVLVWSSKGPFGVLGVYSSRVGAFTLESVDFLQGIKNTLAAAIDRRAVEDRLAYLAQYDALTGLPNRNLFLDRLSQAMGQADRDKRRVGVLLVDVDRFKLVNNNVGHSGGDKLLSQVAQRLQACLRPGDSIARLGGDEFALVLARMAKAEDAAMVADRVISRLAASFQVDGQEIYVSASLGVSIYPNDGTNADTLLKNADMAMYRAKESGRNTYRFYLPEMNARAAERAEIETELRGALERGEFVVYYQPKISIANGAISGFEALLRWQHPRRGLVSPAEFIPILEDTGLIIPVGIWVVRAACKQIQAWQNAGLNPSPIAVNLSARQFKHSDLDRHIRDIQRETQIDPRLLEFELTESVLMSDTEEAIGVLKNIKALGFSLSVDDFGTGYSSLAYLKRFPLDTLKIDRAFIRDLTTDSDNASIATAIINLAHSLKLKVVAEGVETAAQLDFLCMHHCDEMQGYLFARPMPAADATRALADRLRPTPVAASQTGGVAPAAMTWRYVHAKIDRGARRASRHSRERH